MNYTDIEADLLIAQAEIARLEKVLDGVATMQGFYPDNTTFYITSQSYTDKLKAQLWDMTARAEKAEAERDAAVEDIYLLEDCLVCKNGYETKRGIACSIDGAECNFVWRSTGRRTNV